MLPNRCHPKVTSLVQNRRKEEDVFPTLYRCNSIGKLKKVLRENGFECVVYGYEAEPSYLSFSKVAFFFGVIHQKLTPGFLKLSLFAFGKIKKGASVFMGGSGIDRHEL